ncbi:MAG: hypothetical protein H0T79_13290 [Deltaproteobacteria bacterium]|nr:hypothetical protein [Deltaproteobacteria bacterium]
MTTSFRWLLPVAVLLGFGTGSVAGADNKVDWSQYLEPPGTKTPVRATATQPTKASAPAKQASRTVSKQQRVAKAKPKAKSVVRAKRRR